MLLRERILLFSLTFSLLVPFGVPYKRPHSSSTTPEAKLQQINDLARKSKSNVITLDDATYHHYVISKPRPYSLAVFFTASHQKFKCAKCKQLEKEYRIVADSYTTSVSKNDSAKLFFMRVDYESSPRIFQSYNLNSVPFIFYVESHLARSSGSRKPVHDDYFVESRNKYQVEANPSAEALSAFLRGRSGLVIDIKRSMLPLYSVLTVGFIVTAAMIHPIIKNLPLALKIVQSKSLWMIVSAGVYTCAISGLIYDIIRSPQMFYTNPQSGHITFFYPQSSSQFVVEGFIIGFLNLVCAGSLLFIAVIAVKFKAEYSRFMGFIAGFTLFFVCFMQIQSFYHMKNRWS